MRTTSPRILVTLDGSAPATAAIRQAKTLAASIRAEIILLRVIAAPRGANPSPAGDLLPPVDRAEQQADDELRAHERAFADVSVTRVVLVGTDPAAQIIGWLREHPVDYVVMATHGHSGLRRLVAGSVTEAVVRSGLAPVITVRAPERAGSGKKEDPAAA